VTVARVPVWPFLVRQRWTTYQDLDEGAEKPELMLVSTVDFLCQSFHRMVK
jgi:hypothetical protein